MTVTVARPITSSSNNVAAGAGFQHRGYKGQPDYIFVRNRLLPGQHMRSTWSVLQTTTLWSRGFTLTQEQHRMAADHGYETPVSIQGLPHRGEHVHDGSELVASSDWTTTGCSDTGQGPGPVGLLRGPFHRGRRGACWADWLRLIEEFSEQQFVVCATATSAGCQATGTAGGYPV